MFLGADFHSILLAINPGLCIFLEASFRMRENR